MRRPSVLIFCLAVTTACWIMLLNFSNRPLWGVQPTEPLTQSKLSRIALHQPNTFDCTLVSELPAAECTALVMLYESTAGSTWITQTAWLENNTPCAWYGIACRAGHITTLALPRNRLVGTLPADLGQLTHLEKLSLQENQLQGLIPPEWGSLTNLQELTLSFNQLTGTLPAEIGNWVNLQQLYLHVNRLQGPIPATIGNLSQLEKLYLRSNQLTGSIPPEIGNLGKLKELSLASNKLTGSLPLQLSSLTKLELLYLQSNQLNSDLPETLGNLINLQKLYISNNHLSGNLPSSLGNLTNLQELSLAFNNLTSTIPRELGKLTQLQLLYLQSNRLSGNLPETLGELVNLKKLYVSDNRLSGQVPSALSKLAFLQELGLSGNQLSGQIPVVLSTLSHLQRLYLQSNQLEGPIPPQFGSLVNLEKLYLSFNRLTGPIPPQLGNLINVQDLFLAHNQLNGELPATLGNLTNVLTLTVSANQLSGELPVTLTGLQKIQSFRFRDTNLCQPIDAQFQAWLAGIPDVTRSDYSCTPEQGDVYEDDNGCTSAHTVIGDGVIQTHTFHQAGDKDWLHFHAKANVPYRITVSIPTDSPADVVLAMYNDCDDAPVELYDKTFTPGVFTTITRTSDSSVYLQLSNILTSVSGMDVTYQISVRPLEMRTSQDLLILVAGSLTIPDRLQDNIDKVVTTVYDFYRSKGYSDDAIYFLTTNGDLAGRDDDATLDNLQFAITEWAKSNLTANRQLMLYLVDHGDPDIFYLNKSKQQALRPEQLDAWLDQLEDALPGIKITVILEACYSGSFIDGDTSISRNEANRLLITSTNPKNVAYASASGAYFSDFFLSSLEQGYTLYDSFRIARGVTHALVGRLPQDQRQEPQLDANGNGIANEPGDITLSSEYGNGYIEGAQTPNLEPFVAQVQGSNTITNQRGVIQAIVHDDRAVKRVWAVIKAPSYEPPTDSTELVPEVLPTLVLLAQNQNVAESGFSGTFAAEYPGFDEIGVYQVAVYAEDTQGLVSRPKVFEMHTGSQLFLPLVRRN